MTLADRIHDLRMQNGLTLQEIADRMGLSKTTVHKYEIGDITNIPLNKLKQLGDILGCSPQYLLGIETYAPEDTTPESLIVAAVSNLTVEERNELLKFMRYWYPHAFG